MYYILSLKVLTFVSLFFFTYSVAKTTASFCNLDQEQLVDNGICGGNEFCEEYSKLQHLIRRNSECAASLPVRDFTNEENPTVSNLPSCRRGILKNGRIHERSLAPWTWILNVNRQRFPEIILETACLCPYCLKAQNLSEFNYDLIATAITINVPVEYPNRTASKKSMTTQKISVGCRCDFYRVT